MYVVVLVEGKDVLDPTLVGVLPGRDLKVLGPFETPQIANQWAEKALIKNENFVILPIEWQHETTY